MGTELLQFRQAGVPIIDALASVLKKPREEIKSLVEQGRVGFPDVVRAFKTMTEAGGKFAGMGDRYGKSMAGLFEQLKDAADLAKTEFGKAVVEGVGLKDATKDLTAFTGRVREFVNDLRPAIRFAGDLAKATAQVGHEGARIAGIFARTGLEAIPIYVPQLGRAAEMVRGLVADAKSLKIDPVAVGNLAMELADTALASAGFVADEFDAMATKVKEGLIDPLKLGLTDLKGIITDVKAALDQIKAARDFVVGGEKQLTPEAKKGLDQTLADANADLERTRRLLAELRNTLPPGKPPRSLDELKADAAGDLARTKQLLAELKGTAGSGGGLTPSVPLAETRLEAARRRLREHTSPWLQGLKAQQEADARARKAAEFDAAQAGAYPAGVGLLGGAFNALGASARQAAADLKTLRAPSAIAPDILDAARQANQAFGPEVNPVAALRKQVGDLFDARMLGLIPNEGVFNKAVAERFRRATDGIDPRFRLPTAAEYGSQEFARAQSQAIGGQQQDTVPGLLRQLIDEFQQGSEADREIVRELQRVFGKLATPIIIGP